MKRLYFFLFAFGICFFVTAPAKAQGTNGTINACLYAGGCPPSGSGDSAPSINAAIQFACTHTSGTNGYSHVVIPPGNYDVYAQYPASGTPPSPQPNFPWALAIPGGCKYMDLDGTGVVLHYKLFSGANMNTTCQLTVPGNTVPAGRGTALLFNLNATNRTSHIRVHGLELDGGVAPPYMYGNNTPTNCLGWDLTNKAILLTPNYLLEDVRLDHLIIHNFAAELIYGGGNDFTSATPPLGTLPGTNNAVGTFTISGGQVTGTPVLTSYGSYTNVPTVVPQRNANGVSPCGAGGPSFIAVFQSTPTQANPGPIDHIAVVNASAGTCGTGSYTLAFTPQNNRLQSTWLPPFEISDSILYEGVEGISISGPLRASRNQMHDFLANVFDNDPLGEQILDHNTIWNFGMVGSVAAFGISQFGVTCPDYMSCAGGVSGWTGYSYPVQIDHNLVRNGSTGVFSNASRLRIFDNTFTDMSANGVVMVNLPYDAGWQNPSNPDSNPYPLPIWTSATSYNKGQYIWDNIDNGYPPSDQQHRATAFQIYQVQPTQTGQASCTSGNASPAWTTATSALGQQLTDGTGNTKCTLIYKGQYKTPGDNVVTGNTCVAMTRNAPGSCILYGYRDDANTTFLAQYNLKIVGNRAVNQTGRLCDPSISTPMGSVLAYGGGVVSNVEEHDNTAGGGTALGPGDCTVEDTDTATAYNVPVPSSVTTLASHGLWRMRSYLVTFSYTVAGAPATVTFDAKFCGAGGGGGSGYMDTTIPIVSNVTSPVGTYNNVVPVSFVAYGKYFTAASTCNVIVEGSASGQPTSSVTATISISEAGLN